MQLMRKGIPHYTLLPDGATVSREITLLDEYSSPPMTCPCDERECLRFLIVQLRERELLQTYSHGQFCGVEVFVLAKYWADYTCTLRSYSRLFLNMPGCSWDTPLRTSLCIYFTTPLRTSLGLFLGHTP